MGIHTRPVLLGPLTFLLLGKCKGAKLKPLGVARQAAAGVRRGALAAGPRRGRLGAGRRARAGPRLAPGSARRDGVGLCAAQRGLRPDSGLSGHVFRRLVGQSAGGAQAAGGGRAPRPGPRARAAGPRPGLDAARHDALAGRGRWPERVAGRFGPGVGIAGEGGGQARPRPHHGRPFLLAVALPDRPRQRASARCRVEGLDGLRHAEASGGDDSRAGGQSGAGRRGRRIGGQPRGRREPQSVGTHPQPGRPRAHGGRRRGDAPSSASFSRAPRGPTPPPAAALAPHHHDRLVSADRRGAQGPRRLEEGRVVVGSVRDLLPARDRADGPLSGGDRSRRAGPRRVRAGRHGRVFRRAVGGVCLYAPRLGAEFRHPLREAAGDFRRRVGGRGR